MNQAQTDTSSLVSGHGKPESCMFMLLFSKRMPCGLLPPIAPQADVSGMRAFSADMLGG